MGDGFTVNGTTKAGGVKIAMDPVTDAGVADGTNVERVKIGYGANHAFKDVSTTDPLPAAIISGGAYAHDVDSGDYFQIYATTRHVDTGVIRYALTWRVLRPDGTIYEGTAFPEITYPPGANFYAYQQVVPTGQKGRLIGVTIFPQSPVTPPATVTAPWGMIYTQVFLTRTISTPPVSAYHPGVIQLIGGVHSSFFTLAWPGSPIVQPRDVPGMSYFIHPPDGSVENGSGNGKIEYLFPFTNPADYDWLHYRIRSLKFQYNTAAAGSARGVLVSFKSQPFSGPDLMIVVPAVDQPANSTGFYTLAPGLPPSKVSYGSVFAVTGGLPEIEFSGFGGPYGLRIGGAPDPITTGDSITEIYLGVEAWNDVT